MEPVVVEEQISEGRGFVGFAEVIGEVLEEIAVLRTTCPSVRVLAAVSFEKSVVQFLPPIPPGLDRRAFLNRLRDRIETASVTLTQEAAGKQ